MSTTSPEVSPRGLSPSGLVKSRYTRGSYVQRWKALQERNRNLPKIDFTIKSQIIPKRQTKHPGIGTRSLTLDSMKLPSICTASSVITTSTNATGQSAKTARTEKKSINIQESSDREKDLSSSISRSLPNIAQAVQNEAKTQTNNAKHRFEKFTNTKKLTTRKAETKESPKKEETSHPQQPLEKSGIYQIDLSSLAEKSEPSTADSSHTERSQRHAPLGPRFIGTIKEEPSGRNSSAASSRRQLETDKIGRRSRRKKWRDNCKCMRCEIMKRQFIEGDDHYSKWGIYPCMNLSRKKYYHQYFYDSD
ncbi:hypothetical protein FSP39_001107 [Pinctada imbricata]|uniref:Uncharacterized protein n=1 Tax=Pinctada imbricata TaxID=66713 RepID=A0AA88Y2S3_PINIB|nr:hypothetical protein FSP39_001107 [Pinctada imbricata]